MCNQYRAYWLHILSHWSATVMTPPQKYCILDVIKRLINQSRLVETDQNWLKLVETGPNWSKLSKLVKTCNGLTCSKTNRTFIWTFLNLIFLLSDTSNHGWHSMFYESLIILNISSLIFPRGCRPVCYLIKWWTKEIFWKLLNCPGA